MVSPLVLSARLRALAECLERIEDLRSRSASLASRDAEELVAFNLQRAIQAAIDVAAHVVASEGWGAPATLGELFPVLAERGVVSRELGERLRRMVGFRNVLVHAYDDLDRAVVEDVLAYRLDDLRVFMAGVVGRFPLA